MKGLVFDIRHFSIHDGPGIRTTVFLKGCPLRCLWCHNPESQSTKPQTVTKENRIGSKTYCVQDILGKEMSVSEVITEVAKDTPFYDESGGGVTFSGGEPLMQPDFLIAAIDECYKLKIDVAIDTSGFGAPDLLRKIAEKKPLFLFDLKVINNSDSIKYTGVNSNIIINNLKLLDSLGTNIAIRIPLIPTITDTTENVRAIANLVNTLKCATQVNLLPYHAIAGDKYRRLGISYLLKDLKPYTQKELNDVAKKFSNVNVPVTIDA